MKTILSLAAGAALAASVVSYQAPAPMDAATLKATITDMGHTPKDLSTEPGKEKFEFSVTRDTFNIPISAEISPSKNYVWLTVLLGPAPKDLAKHTELLRANADLQPNNFFLVKDKEGKEPDELKFGIGIDNRGIDRAQLRRVIDKIADDVEETADLWQAK